MNGTGTARAVSSPRTRKYITYLQCMLMTCCIYSVFKSMEATLPGDHTASALSHVVVENNPEGVLVPIHRQQTEGKTATD